jgi:hypothetical protein
MENPVLKTLKKEWAQSQLNDTATQYGSPNNILHNHATDTTNQYILPTMEDAVNHPKHYNKHGIECIQAIRAALTAEEFKGYCKGNVIKYTWREQYKNGLEDLKKAAWYLNRLVHNLDKNKNTS